MKKAISFLSLIVFFSCERVQISDPKPVSADVVDCSKITLSKDIQPILNTNCMAPSCHPFFNNYQVLKVRADNGMLMYHTVTNKDMPLNSSLSNSDIAKIKCWLDSGAPNN